MRNVLGMVCRGAVVCLALGFVGTVIGSARGERPVGWRADGTGHFPNATPPTEWSPDEGVLWRTALPGKSHGAPIVVGEHLYVTSDPAHLFCIRTTDGGVEWSRRLEYVDLFDGEKLAEIEKLQAAARELEQQGKALRKALRDRQRADDISEEDERREKERIKELEEKEREIAGRYPEAKKGGSGNSAGTPVSDGSRVYCLFATGLVTAHTLDGERVWMQFVEPAVDGFGHSASPLLVDGKLVVHTRNLVALDPGTGKVLWAADLPKRWGSPIATMIGSEPVIITPSGALVRAGDGAVLATKMFDVAHATPIVDGDVVYAVSKNSRAVRLPDDLSEPVEVDTLWEEDGPRTRSFASPLLHDGLLYNMDERGILEVFDAKVGSLVYQERIPFRGGRAYSSVTLAGKLLFAGNDKGEMLVFRPGRTFEQVAINSLEGFSGAPVFVGRRMYVRGYEHLYCVGE